MDFGVWFSFVITVTVIALTPGPSVLLATANSLDYGFAKTLGTILGDLSANLLQILLASLGVVSFIVTIPGVFEAIKWLGVSYLIMMGVGKIIKSQGALKTNGSRSKNFHQLYRQGFFMSASNPKAIVFFAALFPLFLSESSDLFTQISILTITFLLIDGTSLCLYVLFANSLRAHLEKADNLKFHQRIVGILLLLSALYLSGINI